MTRSVYTGHGYVMNDNRASGGKLVEADVLGCGHCQCSISKPNWIAYGENKCWSCDEPMCSICTFEYKATHVCTNFKKLVERKFEERRRIAP